MTSRDWFDTTHLATDTGGQSVRGGAWSGAAQAAEFFIQLGTLAVLARLLTPSDYGLMGMAMVFVGIPVLFTGGGLNAATIQKRRISHEEVSNLCWINAGLGVLLALVVCALGPVSAAFFHKSELVALVPALSIPILFSGISLQHKALLRRQMLFQRTATVDITAQLIGAAVALTAGFLGAEYWALAYRQLAIAMASSLLLWLACNWRPGKFRRDVNVWRLVRFGGALTASSFLSYIARRIDNVLIGRIFGDGPLGLYEQAYRLLRAPVQQVRAPLQVVSLPAMSVLQDSKEDFARYYYRFVELVAFATMPCVLIATLFADDLVAFVLGPKWLEAATIFRWFGALAFIEPVSTTRGLVMVSHGMARRQLLFQGAFALSNTLAVIIGAQWSVNGVAIALMIAGYVGLIPSMMYCFKNTAVTAAGFFRAISRPLLGSLFVALVGAPCLLFLPSGPVRLFAGSFLCAAAYLGAWWFIPSMRAQGQLLSKLIISKLRPAKKNPA